MKKTALDLYLHSPKRKLKQFYNPNFGKFLKMNLTIAMNILEIEFEAILYLYY
ncbi:hypothetical protein LEP1GSC083_3787 [Leptospira interrogans serovar Pyrogenes str. L0374]|uniref:Uncharacterized protein n=1 Tax=Leptospira interrogans serovar Pyrogenes str. L0374 TaxID=1049928 RepID=M6KHG9_LEPIR|nr:hypothetical protein LEP1GSC083_3787 [Leptospira interrogans serovar Pyrogenes str. L0374]KPA33930.1 Uncharacterized protein AMR50_1288 [Leptospira interrogans]